MAPKSSPKKRSLKRRAATDVAICIRKVLPPTDTNDMQTRAADTALGQRSRRFSGQGFTSLCAGLWGSRMLIGLSCPSPAWPPHPPPAPARHSHPTAVSRMSG